METVADVLAQGLRDFGIERVFGIPGGENVEVVDALRQAGIRLVLVHHEASAVFMADATARLTGRPAACLTTLGPGAANSVAGVAHAYLDRSPVLVITAQIPDSLIRHQPHQYVDLAALFAPITKASIKLLGPSVSEGLEPEGAAETVRRALELTRHGKPGPVHLQVSNEAAGQPLRPYTGPPVPQWRRGKPAASVSGTTAPATRGIAPAPDWVAEFATARKLIERSHRPAIVAGLGLEPERPYELLRRLAEAAGAPVISTPKGKGSLPDDHPLAGGTIGMTRSDPAYKILDEADCILAVGFDAVELVKPWDQAAPLIWIANWENREPVLPESEGERRVRGTHEPSLDRAMQCGVDAGAGLGRATCAGAPARIGARSVTRTRAGPPAATRRPSSIAPIRPA